MLKFAQKAINYSSIMQIPLFPTLVSALIGIILGASMDALSRFGLKFNANFALILDIAKGALACGLSYMLFHNGFGMAVAGVLSVFTQNYSPIALRRNSGAPTALGVALLVNPLPAVLWIIMWATGYGAIKRERIVGDLSGTFGTMILIWTTPSPLIKMTTFPSDLEPPQVITLTLILCFLIFLRLLPQARVVFAKMKKPNAED